MPDAVIAAVEQRAEEEKQPLIIGGCPLFEWRPNNPVQMNAAGEIIDVDDDTADNNAGNNGNDPVPPETHDDDYAGPADNNDDFVFVDEDVPAEEGAAATWVAIDNDDSIAESGTELDNSIAEGGADFEVEDIIADGDDANDTEDEANDLAAEDLEAGDYEDDHGSDDNPATEEPEDGDPDDGPFIVPRYHMRERRQRDYSHRLDHQMDMATSAKSYEPAPQLLQVTKDDTTNMQTPQYIFGHVMTQMTATAGIKKHGQRAVDALLKEFCQLDDKSVFAAVDANSLSSAQKAAALRAINLIKEKRDGELKGGHAQMGVHKEHSTPRSNPRRLRFRLTRSCCR
jgi:hypothetical protein